MSPQQDNDLIKEALFREFLRTKSFNYTFERLHILKEILETSRTIKHFSIDRLYNNLQAKRNRISKSTLYRTIKLLEDSRIVKKTDIAPDHFVYEIVEQYNIGHVVCLKCQKIIEINNRETKKLVNDICRKKIFKYKTHTFEIKGYCQNCVNLSLKNE